MKKVKTDIKPDINLPKKVQENKEHNCACGGVCRKCLLTEHSYTVQAWTQSWSLAGATVAAAFKYAQTDISLVIW